MMVMIRRYLVGYPDDTNKLGTDFATLMVPFDQTFHPLHRLCKTVKGEGVEGSIILELRA